MTAVIAAAALAGVVGFVAGWVWNLPLLYEMARAERRLLAELERRDRAQAVRVVAPCERSAS